jgi:tRNA G18 (ribose-2'-O)-methylase SpoU
MNAQREIWVLLHNIRSAHNVGSMFRTSDAIGVTRIILSGYTPTPLDRFNRPVKEIAKTALGAELSIPWVHIEDPKNIIMESKTLGFTVVGVEQDERSLDYKNFVPSEKTLIVMGEEVTGLHDALRAECDTLLEIPMRGAKESLNVSVAFGITLFRIFDR